MKKAISKALKEPQPKKAEITSFLDYCKMMAHLRFLMIG